MGKVEAPESEKRGGTQTYLKMFPGEGIPAVSKPATRFQKHDAQSRTHDPGPKQPILWERLPGFPVNSTVSFS